MLLQDPFTMMNPLMRSGAHVEEMLADRPEFSGRAARQAEVARRLAEVGILGDDVPDHLKIAGRLRVEHKQASLEELGHMHDPPLTKDAIAGRIRRLLAMADKRARELGIPDTEASLTPDMLADAP